jgi:hypothetical protein
MLAELADLAKLAELAKLAKLAIRLYIIKACIFYYL